MLKQCRPTRTSPVDPEFSSTKSKQGAAGSKNSQHQSLTHPRSRHNISANAFASSTRTGDDFPLPHPSQDRRWRDGCGVRDGRPQTRSPRCFEVPSRRSCQRRAGSQPIPAGYSQVIVDECQHVSAFTFEQVEAFWLLSLVIAMRVLTTRSVRFGSVLRTREIDQDPGWNARCQLGLRGELSLTPRRLFHSGMVKS